MIDLDDWAFISGPEVDPPRSSVELMESIDYLPEEIAGAILAYPGMQLLADAFPTWWDWLAEWRCEARRIRVGMTLFDTEPRFWGGSPLDGVCELEEILAFWNSLRKRCPGVWMHNSNCEIHTPESFAALCSK